MLRRRIGKRIALTSIAGVIPVTAVVATVCKAFFVWLQNEYIDFNSACGDSDGPMSVGS